MTEPQDNTPAGGFRLSSNEDFLFGVNMRGETLRFGPSGAALLWAALAATIAVAVGGLLAFGAYDSITFLFWQVNPTIGRSIGIGLVLVNFANLTVRVRSGVRVRPIGIEVRSWFRTSRYEWNTITGTHIVEDEPLAPFDVGIGEEGGGFRVDVESSKAFLVLDDGSLVRLFGFESAARQAGTAAGSPTPTEIKIGALTRYREDAVGPWPIPN